MPRIQFSPERTTAKPAVVVSFDLCGFSAFCNRSDAAEYLPKYLARLFEEVNGHLMGSVGAGLEQLTEFLGSRAERQKVVVPEHIKFTGDGALMIWETGWDGKFSPPFRTAVVAAMRNLQTRIAKAVDDWEQEWCVSGLPKRARFGIATGPVYALKDPDIALGGAVVDHVGYWINLAVRLQNHCPEVGFLVHEAMRPELDGLVSLEAVGMKGVREEPVLAFASDVQGLDPAYFRTKFRRR